MRLDNNDDNTYIDDRRDESVGGGFGGAGLGGGGFGIPIGRGMGIGGTLILLVLGLVFGGNIFGGGSGATAAPAGYPANGEVARGSGGAPANESPEERANFVEARRIFNDVQTRWETLLPRQAGQQYRPAYFSPFREAVRTGCGVAPAEVGPFYCPADEHVYLDLSFFDELARRFQAPGDFAQAYVIAHEVGHHIQKQVGTEARVRQLQAQRPDLKNNLSVRLELQADCYAGVWGAQLRAEQRLDPGDVEEGLRAASAVGDDRLQRQAGGGVQPDTFTHGTSAQRVTWFRRGFESGDMRNCDTFAGAI